MEKGKQLQNSIKPRVLFQTFSPELEVFDKLYQDEPLKARVYALSNSVEIQRVCFFDNGKENFQIVAERVKYGVSVTLKKYIRTKRESIITVNKSKFYLLNSGKIFVLNIDNMGRIRGADNILTERFPWIRNLQEFKLNIPFNTVVSKKLYDAKKCFRHLYKVPFETGKLIHDKLGYHKNAIQAWNKACKWMTHLENINLELIEDYNYLWDCTKMAEKLNEKVNMRWSHRRLKQEHDKWAKIITDILFSANDRELYLHPVFIELDKQIGGLITTIKDLSLEGMMQKHCVATYASEIDKGKTGIYHIEGYTLQVSRHNGLELTCVQFKGRQNSPAPNDLAIRIQEKIKNFNQSVKDGLITVDNYIHNNNSMHPYLTMDYHELEELPF